MNTKSKRFKGRKTAHASLNDQLMEAGDLLERQNWQEARTLLENLSANHPKVAAVWELLIEACASLNDVQGSLLAVERLAALKPANFDIQLTLGRAYLQQRYPALAIKTLENLLIPGASAEQKKDAGRILEESQIELNQILKFYDLSEAEGYEIELRIEHLDRLMDMGEFRKAIQVGEALLKRCPDFAPVHGQLGIAYWKVGRSVDAIRSIGKVVSLEPENVQATVEMVKYLFWMGKIEESCQWVNKLSGFQFGIPENSLPILEALSLIGDHQEVLQVFNKLDLDSMEIDKVSKANIFHFAAAASAISGDIRQARILWEQSIKNDPTFELANMNMADLDKSVGEKNGPFAFTIMQWMPKALINDYFGPLQKLADQKNVTLIARFTQRFVKTHPEIVPLSVSILPRCDEETREFFIMLGGSSGEPGLMDALLDFSRGQAGRDQLRLEAARAVWYASNLPAGFESIWLEGKLQEVLLLGFDVTGDRQRTHNKKTENLLSSARKALDEWDLSQAEAMQLQAIALNPDAADIQYNLAGIYSRQGKQSQAEAVIEEVYRRFPDYFYGIAGMAQIHWQHGEVDKAEACLEPLLRRKSIQRKEFDVLCTLCIDINLARRKVTRARAWYQAWRTVDPQNPRLVMYPQFTESDIDPV